jgi:hypothetical protein
MRAGIDTVSNLDDTLRMALRAAFFGGPANGTVRVYQYTAVLPSLQVPDPNGRGGAAIYELASTSPDPETGNWPYRFVLVEPTAGPAGAAPRMSTTGHAGTDSGPERPDWLASVSALRSGLALSGLSYDEAWAAYIGMGGTLPSAELSRALRGRRQLSAFDHNVLASALNDHLLDAGLSHPVPYFEELDVASRGRQSNRQEVAAEVLPDTVMVLLLTAGVRSRAAVVFDRLAATGPWTMREHYRDHAQRLRVLAERAEGLAEATVARRAAGRTH